MSCMDCIDHIYNFSIDRRVVVSLVPSIAMTIEVARSIEMCTMCRLAMNGDIQPLAQVFV